MSKKMRNVLGLVVSFAAVLATASGCAEATDGDEGEELGSVDSEVGSYREGVNSKGCKRSAYNCTLNPGKGQRVLRADGKEEWHVDGKWLAARGFVDPQTKQPVTPVVDGNGEAMGFSKRDGFTLNYGQTRRMNDMTWVIALGTGLGAAGWVPLDAFLHADSLRAKVGEVNARGAGMKELGCYEVARSFDKKLLTYKVVKGATDKDAKEPDDYLPHARANGKVYMNLAFSIPGDSLGAPAVDIFPAGTKFQRLDVPTWEAGGAPSLDAKLYAKPAGSAAYTREAGEMKFIYGYVKTKPGAVRYGWMAIDGLDVSRGCPNR